jgi:hypothetical protein
VAVHQKWTGTPHARSALSHRSYHRDLNFSSGNARTRWRACPGFPQTKRPVASAMPASSDACIQRCLLVLGLADEPCPKVVSALIQVGFRGASASKPSGRWLLLRRLSLSRNNRKEDVVDLPAYCRYKYTSSSYYKLDLKCSTKGH